MMIENYYVNSKTITWKMHGNVENIGEYCEGNSTWEVEKKYR